MQLEIALPLLKSDLKGQNAYQDIRLSKADLSSFGSKRTHCTEGNLAENVDISSQV